ncbi:hypothetical protein PTSG_12277 [Salpingoeca rosetta]|uniref:Sorting nexin/Vps5-like C-terminal domain-containing protein n=1 Tax=Salpingoeca rosetta (strain ATCC 50818 / BSB-021) TaxID=946362 RepID=F2UAV0_SALR5|nr:uncharacterized protein PTSG_12277 [Salpingoeca rosetta]EGD73516.1 hypothetical protein PTSG_12277 [Salpingoeca rosetta]|eukprot:XP_004993798.1 hypothetical protein PTSG_12277 [Salpingoeca rosetta]
MHEHLRHVRSPEDEAVVEAYLKQTVDVGQLMSNFLLEKAKAHVAYQKQCQALALQARKRLSEAKDQANWQLNELSPLMRACDTVLGGAEKEALEYGQYADSLLDVANAMTQSLKGREEAIKLLLQQRAELDKELAAADKDLLQLKKANDGAMHALLVARKNVDRAQASSGKTDRAGLKEETAFEFKRTTHNDYLLGITRANTMRTKLLSFDVVEILDSLEDTHARTVPTSPSAPAFITPLLLC